MSTCSFFVFWGRIYYPSSYVKMYCVRDVNKTETSLSWDGWDLFLKYIGLKLTTFVATSHLGYSLKCLGLDSDMKVSFTVNISLHPDHGKMGKLYQYDFFQYFDVGRPRAISSAGGCVSV